ncbi:helix-turn-helix transcriptional regulator [Mycolicibacterium moriokaense]|uniref:ATP/maltotriose-dependent transcriptional regulator MalT n=1 Tax=Mycolicibacterium moriokaense TaxID=39691 RepID=A0A318HMT2_9MYCO|nr:ATP/maltotriose-dependent transcriptional regulator MalT [Mycolicibacterium moriokaense]
MSARRAARGAIAPLLARPAEFAGAPVATVAMPGQVESESIADFLASAAERVSGLVIEGEPGIGKTTLWLGAIEEAANRGFRVVAARAGSAEVVLTFAVLADLFCDVESVVLDELPHVQRVAVNRLIEQAGDSPATDERVLGAAFLSVAERLSADTPVLVAIDDVQWLDASSQAAVQFAVRRLKGRVGVLVTARSDATGPPAASWLQLRRPDGVDRIRVSPLALGGLHTMFSARLGRSLPRPTMVRIAEISCGNPFYALELARSMDDPSTNPEPTLPESLAALVRSRLAGLGGDVGAILLAAATATTPTIELLSQATDTTAERVVELLDEAETQGIVGFDGNRVRFTHPLLATGVYTDASHARRRSIHRRLAEIVQQPELRARHLALAATTGDAATLAALDAAAAVTRARGAPAAAAELVDLAIGLGGDNPQRRMLAAGLHFRAGDIGRARGELEPTIAAMPAGIMRAIALNLLAGARIYDDSFIEAAELLKRALPDTEGNAAVLAQTHLTLSMAQAMAGEFDESLHNAEQSVARAEECGRPVLISQALAFWVSLKCMYGHGVDEASLQRALDLENPDKDVPISFRASAAKALVLAWSGRLDEARTQMLEVRRNCIERGAESDMMWIASYTTLIDIWLGRFADAALVGEDTMERAQQLDGPNMLVIAGLVRTAVAAYRGREHDARAEARQAIDDAQGCGAVYLTEWPIMSLGFLEVSLENYAEALTTLQPLLDRFHTTPGTEIMTSAYLPDAVEAMVWLGKLDDAEPLIDALESNGRRLDRPWMLAVGARCRSMWLAASGDLEAAERAARQAITHHQRLPMPFELARTQLLLGQLERRQRHREAAAATLRTALEAFEEMGTPLWAERARGALARTAPRPGSVLIPSEQRIAELAASGMSNQDIAAALFISSKTVEANLTRVYRKLAIRSRAQLSSHLTHG